MTYTVYKTNSTALVNIFDGVVDESTGLQLIGKNVSNYGLLQNENFVRLLENFAGDYDPTVTLNAAQSLVGQLWYDTAGGTSAAQLKVFNGTDYVPVTGRRAQNVAPTALAVGEQWWDTGNNQLNIWTGTSWQLIGPLYSSAQGVTGAIVSEHWEQNGVTKHTTVDVYTGGTLLGIATDASFTSNVVSSRFGSFRAGLNLANDVVLNGTAFNSENLDGISSESFARVDQNSTFTGNITVNSNIKLAGTQLYVSNGDVIFKNSNSGGDINFLAGGGTPLSIDGATGLVTIAQYPVNDNNIASKRYVDDFETVIQANIAEVRQETASTAGAIADSVVNYNNAMVANVTQMNVHIRNLETIAPYGPTTANILARLLAPEFYGNTTAKPITSNISGAWVATNQSDEKTARQLTNAFYVDYQDNSVLQRAQDSLQANLTVANTRIGELYTVKSNIASPTFTGSPTVNASAPNHVSDPTVGSNSTRLASTENVTAGMRYWRGGAIDINDNDPPTASMINSRRFIATTGPISSRGIDGDFWFQIST